ncbi:MAG: acetyl ornithine aminotransferase family protein [Candidatus Stahlbacteria bacterium]|nr:acetyl ornithine aminotransferase family protein [Candidatus Stahlbacteria bacterium]
MERLNLPGPKSKLLIEEDTKFISPSYGRPHNIAIERGEGVWVWDVDGNKFMDFTTGIAVCSTGHCHPEVVRALQEQAELLLHMSSSDFRYPSLIKLAKKLAEITPGNPHKRTFFCNSGAESIEAAIKLARWTTKRKLLLAYFGAFHGRTYGAMSLTASKSIQRDGFEPLVPGVIHIPYPYCYRCIFNLTYPDCNFNCIKYIENVIFKTIAPPTQVAACFAEPIQGEGGYIVPPDGYFQELKKLLDKYEILFVDDEVQAGMGRTGKMFAIEHWEVIPDIICIAKGIASGMPIGVTVARKGLMEWPQGAHASTFGGNPVSCEAAMATIKLLEDELMENAKNMGNYLLEELHKLADKHSLIGDIRGKGLMVACELVLDKKTKEKAKKETSKIIDECCVQGLLLLSCGENGIRFMPPLTIKKEELDLALQIFDDALKEVEK